jgi:hypothetical protein
MPASFRWSPPRAMTRLPFQTKTNPPDKRVTLATVYYDTSADDVKTTPSTGWIRRCRRHVADVLDDDGDEPASVVNPDTH